MQEIKSEYWELIRELNRGNKQKNEKTEIVFEVININNRILISNIDHNKLILCSEIRKKQWFTINQKYLNLSTAIIKHVLVKLHSGETKVITDEVKSFVFKKVE